MIEETISRLFAAHVDMHGRVSQEQFLSTLEAPAPGAMPMRARV